jgi:hypothetical protein
MTKNELKKLKGPNGGRLNYFYSFDCTLGTLRLSSKKEAISTYTFMFFRAKNKEEILKAVEQIEGECVSLWNDFSDLWNDFSDFLEGITKGEEINFLAGDPMSFKGLITGIVKIGTKEYLEIKISDEIFAYFLIREGNIHCIRKARKKI